MNSAYFVWMIPPCRDKELQCAEYTSTELTLSVCGLADALDSRRRHCVTILPPKLPIFQWEGDMEAWVFRERRPSATGCLCFSCLHSSAHTEILHPSPPARQ